MSEIVISGPVAVTLVVAFLGMVAAFGRVLLGQFEKRMTERFDAQDDAREMQLEGIQGKQVEEVRRVASLQKRLEQLGSALPLEYVRREDWIRFSASIDHKLDRLAELVMSQGNGRARD